MSGTSATTPHGSVLEPGHVSEAALSLPRLYPGLASFRDTSEDRMLFFGREAERIELRNLVFSESLVVLFGRSGLGKSSLLNVWLMEDLRTEHYIPIPVRLKAETSDAPMDAILQGVRSVARSLGSDFSGIAGQGSTSSLTLNGGDGRPDLWEFFHYARFRRGDRALRPVLIIDQFEELFTAFEPNDEGRKRFVETFADLARRRVPDRIRDAASRELDRLPIKSADQAIVDRRAALVRLVYENAVPDVKLVIAIREDYLPELHSLREFIPSILRYSLRLEPFTRDKARLAIEEPAKHPVRGGRRVSFAPGVVDSMLAQLSSPKGAPHERMADRIEPAQLQILCRFVEEHVGPLGDVTEDHVRRWGGLQTAFEQYYDGVLDKIPRVRPGPNERGWRPSLENAWILNRPRAATRWLCQHGLVDSSGYRASLNAEVMRRRFGIPDKDVQLLLNERLLNEQPRPDTKAYELAHDSLVGPLMTMRRTRIYRQVLTAIVLILLAPVSVQSVRFVQRLRAERIVRENIANERAIAENAGASPAARRAALSNLYKSGTFKPVNPQLARLRLRGVVADSLDLRTARLDSADFDSAVLNRAVLDSASLRGARLSNSVLRQASLREADLTSAILDKSVADSATFARANFANATLSGVSLVGARLTSANLTNAKLTDADLRLADVGRGVKIEGVDLTGTAWWLARGWSGRQIDTLRRRFPPERFESSAQYRRWRDSLDAGVNDAISLRKRTRGVSARGTDSVLVDTVAAVLMSAYHRRARFEALQGIHFDSAYEDVKRVFDQPEYSKDPDLLDTRAYILIRWVWDDPRSNPRRGDARRDLLVALRQDVSAVRPAMGERFYHLGLVYEALKDSVPAIVAFQNAAAAGYDPTYERGLTPSRWAAKAYGSRWPYDP